jgi:hypothetical protein
MDAVPLALPDLDTLRDRWRTLAIAYQACDLPDIWATSTASDTHADPIGSGLELLVFRSRAAVLTAFDADLPDAMAWGDPILLGVDAPPWVRPAIDEVAPLGDAAWWDGTGWYRSPAAATIPRSVEVMATPLLAVEGMADQLLMLLDDYPASVTEAERALALTIASGRPTAEGLIQLYSARRYGFDPDLAHAAIADHS